MRDETCALYLRRENSEELELRGSQRRSLTCHFVRSVLVRQVDLNPVRIWIHECEHRQLCLTQSQEGNQFGKMSDMQRIARFRSNNGRIAHSINKNKYTQNSVRMVVTYTSFCQYKTLVGPRLVHLRQMMCIDTTSERVPVSCSTFIFIPHDESH